MRVRADFSERIAVLTQELPWVPSPAPGVRRRLLDRVGGEVARATSVVSYAPNAAFPWHEHGGGEELLVLDGLFADELGAYPKGTYVRNPVGSAHAPHAGPDGARLFVKLAQMAPDDTQRVSIDTTVAAWMPGAVPGLSVLPLHDFGDEHVALVRWAPHTRFHGHAHWGGEEILVLDGVFRDEHGTYPAGSWLRSLHLSRHAPFTSEEGATIFVKVGHLATMPAR